MNRPDITFSFGQNWTAFVKTVTSESLERAQRDIEEWLGSTGALGKQILDIGCGSGIHSYCFEQLGAGSVLSFDIDPASVAATTNMWALANQPKNWKIITGSILDSDFLQKLGQFDIVYAWGCLHHTGALWRAVDNACSLVAPGGMLWIALYVKGPRYPHDLALKHRYNRAGPMGKRLIEGKEVLSLMWDRLQRGYNPLDWNERRERGMDVHHDLLDWLGGLPYEVASKEEVIDFGARRGFSVVRSEEAPEGGNNIYLLRRELQS